MRPLSRNRPAAVAAAVGRELELAQQVQGAGEQEVPFGELEHVAGVAGVGDHGLGHLPRLCGETSEEEQLALVGVQRGEEASR